MTGRRRSSFDGPYATAAGYPAVCAEPMTAVPHREHCIDPGSTGVPHLLQNIVAGRILQNEIRVGDKKVPWQVDVRFSTPSSDPLFILKPVKTLRFKIRPDEAAVDHPAIVECSTILQRGGLVAMPTETVYGLAANALNPAAVARIFEAKQRPSWDPLIVHVSDFEMVSRVASEFPLHIHRLADRFWPGPLTLLLQKASELPQSVTAGLQTVAVRMPAHPVAHTLISAANLPLAAPSANRFGHASPTTAEHVLRDLDGVIDAVLDAGPTDIGVESTVLDALRTPPVVLRPGGVTREQLESVLGRVEMYSARQQPEKALPSPGLSFRHYAPEAKLILVDGKPAALLEALSKHVAVEGEKGQYVGVMAPTDWIDAATLARGGLVIFDWGTWGNWAQLAQNLFSGLRYLDKPAVSIILCPLPPEEGLGLALRDRLTRAAR